MITQQHLLIVNACCAKSLSYRIFKTNKQDGKSVIQQPFTVILRPLAETNVLYPCMLRLSTNASAKTSLIFLQIVLDVCVGCFCLGLAYVCFALFKV